MDLVPNNVNSSDIQTFLGSKPLREYRKPNFKTGQTFGISMFDVSFGKCYKPQLTQKVFEIVVTCSRKPPTYSKKNVQDEIIRIKFHKIG